MPLRHAFACVLVTAAACSRTGPSVHGAASRQVQAAMEHYDSLIRRTAGDSIAAMYLQGGELLG